VTPPSLPRRRRWLGAAAGLAAAVRGVPALSAPSPLRTSVQVLRPDWPSGTSPTTVPAWAAGRALRLCLPSGHGEDGRRHPVVYMPDGQNLFDAATAPHGGWAVAETMDTLAAEDGLAAIVVGIDHGGDRRNRELSPWSHPRIGTSEGEAYLAFMTDTVKPWVDGHLHTRPGREHTVVVGSSLGALMAHHALHQRPEVFGAAGVLSPAYWISEQCYEDTRDHPRAADSRLFLYAGDHEGPGVVGDLLRMHALLAAQRPASGDAAAALRLVITPEAEHDERAWRAVLPQALRWLLAPGAAR
jgi:predicted alpha/beta superfamily hydrolase